MHVEMSIASGGISIHDLEYSPMLSRSCRRLPSSFSHHFSRESDRRIGCRPGVCLSLSRAITYSNTRFCVGPSGRATGHRRRRHLLSDAGQPVRGSGMRRRAGASGLVVAAGLAEPATGGWPSGRCAWPGLFRASLGPGAGRGLGGLRPGCSGGDRGDQGFLPPRGCRRRRLPDAAPRCPLRSPPTAAWTDRGWSHRCSRR